jgi:hypothetical protein
MRAQCWIRYLNYEQWKSSSNCFTDTVLQIKGKPDTTAKNTERRAIVNDIDDAAALG